MNILPTTCSNAISFLQQNLRYPLTIQQKKILVIALAVLAVTSIVVCYLFQCLCFKAKPLNGPGEITKEGNVYKGIFKDGKLEGRGTITSPNGMVQEGEFKDDLFDGPGKVIAKDGTVMAAGKYEKGKLEGPGKLIFADQATYEGEFHENKPHGTGKFKDADGVIYEGSYKNGVKNGKGKLTDKDGNATDVEYVDGKLKPDEKKDPDTK